jgi:hypothetical protein
MGLKMQYSYTTQQSIIKVSTKDDTHFWFFGSFLES